MDFDDLKRKYRSLLAPRFNFECGEGWIAILAALFDALEAELPAGIDLRVTQIKEKFGGLRVYRQAEPTMPDQLQWRIYRLIALAEARSFHVCEHCGRPARLWERQGFFVTACDRHADEHGGEHRGRPARPIDLHPCYERFEDVKLWYCYDFERDDFFPCPPPPGFRND
ncbi:hypothetical protein [Rhizobium sp.]|uniref:hypothetical protein n=1 Tax=Rhizobium sp. TaxID=391 RepID=UPI0028B215E2